MEKQEILTEVMSVSDEEKRIGETIPIPSREELIQKASMSFIRNKTAFGNLFPKLSSKQKNRVALAILEMPIEGIPVLLKSNEEKLVFAVGQRLLADRFLLTYDSIVQKKIEDKGIDSINKQPKENENENI